MRQGACPLVGSEADGASLREHVTGHEVDPILAFQPRW